jgi:hypothetical protein
LVVDGIAQPNGSTAKVRPHTVPGQQLAPDVPPQTPSSGLSKHDPIIPLIDLQPPALSGRAPWPVVFCRHERLMLVAFHLFGSHLFAGQ